MVLIALTLCYLYLALAISYSVKASLMKRKLLLPGCVTYFTLCCWYLRVIGSDSSVTHTRLKLFHNLQDFEYIFRVTWRNGWKGWHGSYIPCPCQMCSRLVHWPVLWHHSLTYILVYNYICFLKIHFL